MGYDVVFSGELRQLTIHGTPYKRKFEVQSNTYAYKKRHSGWEAHRNVVFSEKGGRRPGRCSEKLQADIGAYLTEQDRELVQRAYVLLPRLTKGNSAVREEE